MLAGASLQIPWGNTDATDPQTTYSFTAGGDGEGEENWGQMKG